MPRSTAPTARRRAARPGEKRIEPCSPWLCAMRRGGWAPLRHLTGRMRFVLLEQDESLAATEQAGKRAGTTHGG